MLPCNYSNNQLAVKCILGYRVFSHDVTAAMLGDEEIRNINWFGYVWYSTACLNVSTFLITRAEAAGRTNALERLERAPGRKCPAHRRMRCARAAQSIVAGAGDSG